MNKLVKLELTDADLPVTIYYTEDSISHCFVPLCNNIENLYRDSTREPFIIGLGGPPGSGKSVIALTISSYLKNRNLDVTILPLDGFHLKNEVLKERTIARGFKKVTLYEIKGAKETYDMESFLSHLAILRTTNEEFYWPVYSRKIHQPVLKGIKISDRKKIFIIEGNYLFLGASPWNSVREFFDLGIFIIPLKRLLRKRIINRKLTGGISKKEARRHYRKADRINIKEVLKESTGYDHIIRQKSRYRYVLM